MRLLYCLGEYEGKKYFLFEDKEGVWFVAEKDPK